MQPTRRSIIAALIPAATLPVTRSHPAGAQTRSVLDLTPECGKGGEPTMAQTEGPYFKPDAPLKRDLAVDAPNGERITLAGFVLDARCQPVPKALVQLWHADETGAYDNAGFRLRGYQLCRRHWALVVFDHRARPISRPDPSLSYQGSETRRAHHDHPAVFSGRSAEPSGRAVRSPSVDADHGHSRRPVRAVRLRRIAVGASSIFGRRGATRKG